MKLHLFGISLLFALVAMMAPASANAQNNVAVVDLKNALDNYHKTKSEAAKLEAMAKEKRTNLDQREADYQLLTGKIPALDKKARDTSLPDAARQAAIKELQALANEIKTKEGEINNARMKYSAEIRQAKATMEITLLTELKEVVSKLAEGKGYDLVIDKSYLPASAAKAVVYTSTRIPDLTGDLITAVNANAPATPAPAAPPVTTGAGN